MTLKTGVFDEQVRFNWGFHDGAADALRAFRIGEKPTARWSSPHPDSIYEAGWKAGSVAGDSTKTSSAAWEHFQATRTDLVPAGTPDPRD